MEWRDTADEGQRAELAVDDLCVLDSRPLAQHPMHAALVSLLQAPAEGRQAGGAGAGGGGRGRGGVLVEQVGLYRALLVRRCSLGSGLAWQRWGSAVLFWKGHPRTNHSSTQSAA